MKAPKTSQHELIDKEFPEMERAFEQMRKGKQMYDEGRRKLIQLVGFGSFGTKLKITHAGEATKAPTGLGDAIVQVIEAYGRFVHVGDIVKVLHERGRDEGSKAVSKSLWRLKQEKRVTQRPRQKGEKARQPWGLPGF